MLPKKIQMIMVGPLEFVFKVMKIPTLRLYWRFGRRGGKLMKQPEPDEIFSWVQEDYTEGFDPRIYFSGVIRNWLN